MADRSIPGPQRPKRAAPTSEPRGTSEPRLTPEHRGTDPRRLTSEPYGTDPTRGTPAIGDHPELRDHPAPRDAEAVGPGPGVEARAPDSPAGLTRASWFAVLRGTVREVTEDELMDRAAALTYYGVLSLFPGLLALVSLLGISGRETTDRVMESLGDLAPGPAREVLEQALASLRDDAATGATLAVVGLVVALWSSSGYVGAFMRAANSVHDVPEGRPLWKLLPLRLGMTAALTVMAAAGALLLVLSGDLARRAGDVLGVGDTALTVWSVAKWPVLLLLAVVMIALLYWASPNAKGRGWRWVTPGSVLALLIWAVASAGFAVYVAEFASYNRVYGTMAGVVVFLVWLWISNLAVLLGLEFDAELLRRRAVAGGMPPDREPYVEPRDTRAWNEDERRLAGLPPQEVRDDDR
ncbi:YhjD/YihY/BrkB family envelope integrity protein [Streptomyces sp. NPDC012421]|uniref:YihY/virulence factor BrkB family protein n=1 Tax=Streptomyces sp. NPDC012421 TaxID=3364832 RepID=UPI0036E5B86F